MQKLTPIARTIWTLIVLFNITYIHGMLHFSLERNPHEYLFCIQRMKELTQEKSQKAGEYNQKNLFLNLPNNALKKILSYCHADATDKENKLKNDIKNFIQFKTTCTRFHKILTCKTIGEFCKDYPQDNKNKMLEILMRSMYLATPYKFQRKPILLLSYTGANTHVENNCATDYLLERAIDADDVEMITTLLKHSPNTATKLLGKAIKDSDIRMLTTLLKHKEQQIITKIDYSSPQSICTSIEEKLNNYTSDQISKALQILITQGHITQETIKSILYAASAQGHIKTLHSILAALENNQAIEVILRYNLSGETLLHSACCNGHLEVIETLLKIAGQHAPNYVSIQNKNGYTPLMRAVQNGHKDVAQLIIRAAGEQVWHILCARDKPYGRTALMYAAGRGYISILEDLLTAAGERTLDYLLMRSNIDFNAFYYASEEAHIFLEEALIEATKIECPLCLDKKMPDKFHSMNGCNTVDNTISGCEYRFCTECLLQHIAVRLDEGSTRELTCPNIQCGKKMHQTDVQAVTQNNKDLYDRFDAIRLKEYLADNPRAKHCQTPDCSFSFILEEDAERRIIECICNRKYCSHCLFNHKLKITCEQAKEERELTQDPERAQTATQKWLAENTKQCPQCKTPIQKNMGCNHMTCKKCTHEFCWTCLATYGTTRCGNNGCAVAGVITGLNF